MVRMIASTFGVQSVPNVIMNAVFTVRVVSRRFKLVTLSKDSCCDLVLNSV